jgi:hypothetical protein
MAGLWQGWRERVYLRRAIGNFRRLDDHLLRDIGLTRAWNIAFLLMSRATTAPDRPQKQQESSQWPARLFLNPPA